MKVSARINSNVRLIRTFINFPVLHTVKTQEGNSLKYRRPDWEHVALRCIQGALDSHHFPVRSAGLHLKHDSGRRLFV